MSHDVDIGRIDEQLSSITRQALQLEAQYAAEIEAVHPEYHYSARNLVHYLALRQSDISELQEDLTELGLSSLGRAERNVMGTLQAVSRALHSLTRSADDEAGIPDTALELKNPVAAAHKQAIVGETKADRDVAIMVTLPPEAAENAALVGEMVGAGMNVARINCAHDDPVTWASMVDNVRSASPDCRIMMDLAGPKLRTGPLRPGPGVLHIRPKRDPLGRVIAPRRVRFMPDDVLQRGSKAAVVPVPRECVETAKPGDELCLRDTRGKKRRLQIVEKDARGLIVESHRGSYLATGTRLRLVRNLTGDEFEYEVGELPEAEQPLLLRIGDTLVLHRSSAPGEPAVEDEDGNVVCPAHIACQQPEVFRYVKVGDPVSLNDGKITGVVVSVSDEQLDVEITRAKPTGSNLRGNRGINFPGSEIELEGLTDSDRNNLEFIVEHADAVALSFARSPDDIRRLQDELARYPDQHLALVVKIETKRGFRNLPGIMLAAMRTYPAAVMIARGDLAVECGWERLAELQEEILWFCEAAHMPVIWATQVLEQSAKKGLPSRAEISDAAMSQQADCVMLNKGPHIIAAIRMLDNILRRMQKHHFKKTARMRKLHF